MAELYDLKKDPEERVNLVADSAAAGTLASLRQELEKLMAATGLTTATDKMPIDAGIKSELPDQKIR
jgi:N-acetylglucosamine-6-sulfatase